MHMFELKTVPPERIPVVGEIRYIVHYIDNPNDPGSVIPTDPQRIVWNGQAWLIEQRVFVPMDTMAGWNSRSKR